MRECYHLYFYKSKIFIYEMQEALIRQELPIQSVRDRGDACYAIVPVHLKILDLDSRVRTEPSLLRDARRTVREWYNEDMDYYLGVLREDGTSLSWLRGYEEFNENWGLGSNPGKRGFLNLWWIDKGEDSSEVHTIGLLYTPVFLYNQHNEFGEFYTPEFCKSRGWSELMYKNLKASEVIRLSPEKMRRYGIEKMSAKINEKGGIAEVVSRAFCSGYHENMAITLLLRDFAVFYLNKLLDVALEGS